MIVTTLTTKYQATVPLRVRELLSLAAGDRIAWAIDSGGTVRVRKAPPEDSELGALEATLAPEWDSAADDLAYAGL